METTHPSSLPIPRKYFLFLMYLYVSALVLMVFTTYPGFNWYDKDMFSDMVYGKAYKPFAYRMLLPATVRTITGLSPQFAIDRIESFAKSKWLTQEMIYIADMDEEYIYEFLVALFVMLLCFVGFAYVLRRLIMLSYDFPDFVADLVPVGALILIPLFFRYYNQLYDPPTLFLFAAGLLMVLRKQRLLFFILFILAAFNKETAPLLSIPFIFMEWKNISRLKLFGYLALQFIIWIGAKIIVTYLYAANPGPFITFNFIHHTLTMPLRPFPLSYMLFVLVGGAILIAYNWRDKPLFLRRTFLVSFIVLALVGMLFGVIDELRIFYEIYPLAFLLITPTIVGLFDVAQKRIIYSGNSQ